MTGLDALAGFEALARSRRTNLLVQRDRPVDPALVDRLIALATWAPNHKRTWPWRFTVFTGEGRAAIGEAFAADQADAGMTDEAKLAKTRRKYHRAPVVVAVASLPADSAERTAENRDAVAAGIQNLLLGAAAAGLAGFWSSAPAPRGVRALSLCELPADAEIVGVVYLGWPESDVEVPERPAPVVVRHS